MRTTACAKTTFSAKSQFSKNLHADSRLGGVGVRYHTPLMRFLEMWFAKSRTSWAALSGRGQRFRRRTFRFQRKAGGFVFSEGLVLVTARCFLRGGGRGPDALGTSGKMPALRLAGCGNVLAATALVAAGGDAMREKCGAKKKNAGSSQQEEEYALRQMSGAEQIPDTKGDQASQSQGSADFLSEPSQDQADTNTDRPESEAEPLLRSGPRAGGVRDFADGECEDGEEAENAPNAGDPSGGERERTG